MIIALLAIMTTQSITSVDRPLSGTNSNYVCNRAPLKPSALIELPINSFQPGGWLRRTLELQRDGLAGHLGEISVWLTKEDNAWLSPSGQGKYGWEEVPYWLRGYARIAYALRNEKMIAETKIWVEGTINSARANGDFGPVHNHSKGFRDLWAQMLMLQVLQGWYEYCSDKRVIPLMTKYFRWQNEIPDDQFLEDYWENSRGGDNLASIYWLYNRTGDAFLLELAQTVHRNTANWRLLGNLPNYHNVNIAQCFREPASYYLQSHKQEDLDATYRDFDFIREKFGQVPGGMFGADENARPGHDDPHQATETCGFVEQLLSNAMLMSITGDAKWTSNSEDIAFNSLPATMMPDCRSLRYLTAPNMITSDGENHSPGLDNPGPYLLMNPFSSRCCQHNHTSGWVAYLSGTWMATPDNGLAALMFCEGKVTAKVANGIEVTIATTTKYPFDDTVKLTITATKAVKFPLYVLVPQWADGASVSVGGEIGNGKPGKYIRIEREWRSGDTVDITVPMRMKQHVWDQMKDSVSINCGPLTFSLKIGEQYNKVDSSKSAQHDSGWKPGADATKWQAFEILPTSPWNYGLVINGNMTLYKKRWPSDNYPFTLQNAPIEIRATAKRIPTWTIDQDGLIAILPKSPVTVDTKSEEITLVPMGCARLRVSSFPVVR